VSLHRACCCKGAYYIHFVPCPANSQCQDRGPDIYVKGTLRCANGAQLWYQIILLDHPELEGCWLNTDQCKYHSEPGPPPPGRCELPDGAILVDDGVECIGTCSDPRCAREGRYLVADTCQTPCGNPTDKILVCPPPEMDLTKCWWAHFGAGCGCIIVGPHSRYHQGSTDGWTVADLDIYDWHQAWTPQAACCECCYSCAGGCDYNIVPANHNTPGYPYCWNRDNNGEAVTCCCGSRWWTVSYTAGKHRNYSIDSNGNISEFTTIGRSASIVEWAKGPIYAGCVSISSLVTKIERYMLHGELVTVRTEYVVDDCGHPDYNSVTGRGDPGCLMRAWDRGPCFFHGDAPETWSQTAGYERNACQGTYETCEPSACTGIWKVSAGCYHSTIFIDWKYRWSNSQGARTEEDKRLSVHTSVIIREQPPGCGGGCPGKQPIPSGAGSQIGGGAAPPPTTRRVGAEDFL
jgi:hypothetical protein